MPKTEEIVNHIAFVLDGSGSMRRHERNVVSAVKKQMDAILEQSEKLGQDSRVSVYWFDTRIECFCFETNPKAAAKSAEKYYVSGSTALIDAVSQAIRDLEEVPTKHGNHAFLLYVLTDGEENASSKYTVTHLTSTIARLSKTDNWTIAIQVPNITGKHYVKRLGVPDGNIEVWDTTTDIGFEEAQERNCGGLVGYLGARSMGATSSLNYFQPNTNFTATAVKKELSEIKNYKLFPVRADAPIKEFVESWTKKAYAPGSSYYELTKPEVVQTYKQMALLRKTDGKVFGGPNTRDLLGLPNYEVKVNPASHKDYRIFVQSSSVNRKLVAGTQLLVL